MATLGERIKPSLKQSNPIAFNNINYSGITEMTDQDWLNFAISNQFFYSPLDPATRFTYKTIYDDNLVALNGYNENTLNKVETIANAKNAWLEATYHHMEYCQVFPKGKLAEISQFQEDWNNTNWFTFYEYFPIEETDHDTMLRRLDNGEFDKYEFENLKTDYIMNIKKFNHNGIENIETLFGTQLDYGLKKIKSVASEVTEYTNDIILTENDVGKYYKITKVNSDNSETITYYQCVELPYENCNQNKGATQYNLEIYNQAYYVRVQRPEGTSIDSFISYIENMNDSLQLCLPTSPGFYRYDKRAGAWVAFDVPVEKVVN